MARPQRIVLVRHGESEGNVDETIYERVPDHALELTWRGRKQAEATGEERDRLFAAQAQRSPQFAEYQEKTDRVIPVIVLTPH